MFFVASDDFTGETNVDLLMKCCRSDGLILKPSRPLTSTDDNILKHAYPNMTGECFGSGLGGQSVVLRVVSVTFLIVCNSSFVS